MAGAGRTATEGSIKYLCKYSKTRTFNDRHRTNPGDWGARHCNIRRRVNRTNFPAVFVILKLLVISGVDYSIDSIYTPRELYDFVRRPDILESLSSSAPYWNTHQQSCKQSHKTLYLDPPKTYKRLLFYILLGSRYAPSQAAIEPTQDSPDTHQKPLGKERP